MQTHKTERQKLVEQYQNLQTNDELLAAQALYYKQKKERQSKLNKANDTGNQTNDTQNPPKKSKFKQKMESMAQGKNNKSENETKNKPKFQQSSLIVGDIIERNTVNLNQNKHSSFTITERGFPSVFKHTKQEISANVELHQNDSMWHHRQFLKFDTGNNQSTQRTQTPKKQKLSLFAQKMQQNKPNQNFDNQQNNSNECEEQKDTVPNLIGSAANVLKNENENETENVSFIQKLNMKSSIITEGDIHKIGAENDRFLQEHKQSEIMEMRQQLLSSLDPNIIALLTGKGKEKSKIETETVAKKKKIKIGYEHKDKSTVIRKMKPIIPKRKFKNISKKKKVKKPSKEWTHPATEIKENMGISMVDNNTDLPGPTQTEKMAWMEPLNVAAEKDKYSKSDNMPMMFGDNPLTYFRFGFDGTVLCDHNGIINKTETESDIIVSGLHHHGDEPLKPGYTINELIRLSKSTVSNQRNTAIKTLTCIVHKMRFGQYGMDYSEYLWVLLQEKNLARLVIDILSIEKTASCVVPVLDLLRAIVVPMRVLNEAKQECNTGIDQLLFDGFHILCNTLPNIAPAHFKTNQSLFESFSGKSDEKSNYETGSFAQRKRQMKAKQKQSDMDDIWKCDVILGMLRDTRVIKYLNGILIKYVLVSGGHNMYIGNILPSLLDIAMTFAMHHPQIIESMLVGEFMQNLCAIVFADGVDALYKCKVMDIISVMCAMNKKCVEYLVKYDRLNDFKAFIVEGIDFCTDIKKVQLSISALTLWRVCIKYGYDFNAFTDLLPKLMKLFAQFAMKFGDHSGSEQKVNAKVFAMQQRQTRALLNVIQMLLQCLTPTNLKSLPSITTVSWNQIAKLTEKFINLFDKVIVLNGETMSATDYVCIGGLAYIISTYFKTLREQNDESVGQSYEELFSFAKKQCMVLCKKHIATWSIPKENRLLHSLLLNKRNWTYNNTETAEQNTLLVQFPFLDGLLCDIPLSIAVRPNNEYLSKCDFLLGVIQMIESFVKINSKIIPILIQSHFIDSIGRILLQITNKHFHFRLNRTLRSLLFDYWRIEFLLAYHILSLCNLCKTDLSQIQTLNAVNIHSAACVLLECIPPGYQHLADKLLNKYILSRNYLPSLKKLSTKYLRKVNNSALLNGKLTTFYIESDINAFHTKLIDIYTKNDKYLPNVFNRKIRTLCSRNHSCSNVSRITSLCCIPTMVPTFWLLQPMINLYKHSIPSEAITTLLHFFFILSKCYNDDFMDEIITFADSDSSDSGDNVFSYENNIKSHHYWCNIAVWDAYRTIGTLYLCDSNLYSDELNRVLIQQLMEQFWNRIYYAQHKNEKNNIYLCDKNDPSSACIVDYEINEISDNYNIKSLGREWEGFYNRLMEQFQSDSFGDELFAKIILFQQQMKYNKRFRTILWTQIDSFGILLQNEYPSNIYEWKSFFIPFESDKVIIDCQFQSIAKNETHLRNLANCNDSFLYCIAIVELSHYIWATSHKNDKNIKTNMLNNVLNQCEKSVVIDIINCNFENIHNLVIENSDECIKELKAWINIGKKKITMDNDDHKLRISILKKDFASVCKELCLFE